MKVPKFIKQAIEAVHIDEQTNNDKEKHDKQMDKNADVIRKKAGLNPSKKQTKTSPEAERLKKRIQELEHKLGDITKTQAKSSDDIFNKVMTGDLSVEEVLEQIT